MKKLSAIACLLLCHALGLNAQTIKGLPVDALVLEKIHLVSTRHPNRGLILWMVNPKRNPRDATEDLYTCPEYTRGSYYSGPTRVSLYDSLSMKVINTIKVIANYEDNSDSFDVPYAIRRGYYYHVDNRVPKTRDAKPVIMWLKDYNGDGKALEFALFDALACMGLETALIGYSENRDQVIQYPISLRSADEETRTSESLLWADYLFAKRPLRPGYWKYKVDYRGRGGSLDKWEVKYNRVKERFEGTVARVSGEP